MGFLCALPLLVGSLFAGEGCCAPSCNPCGELDCPGGTAITGCVSLPQRKQTYFTGYQSCQEACEVVPCAEIYYKMQGTCCAESPTLVFIHGFAETSDVWSCAQTELSSCFCTVSMDLRGSGRSSLTPAFPEPDGIHYTVGLNVDDIYQLLSELGITQNIVLVAHSLSSNYALSYAAQYPEQVTKVVLVGALPFIVPNCAVLPTCDTNCFNPATCETNFCYENGITQDGIAYLTGPLVSCLQTGGSEQDCLQLWGQFLAPIWYNEPCQAALANAQAALISAVASSTVPIISSQFAYAGTEDFRLNLSSVTAPVLIAYGSIDLAVNPANSQFLHDNLPNSVIAEFVGKGHQLHVTDYKNFDRLLKEFVNSCSFPDSTIIFDQGCCVCPKAKPVDYCRQSCAK